MKELKCWFPTNFPEKRKKKWNKCRGQLWYREEWPGVFTAYCDKHGLPEDHHDKKGKRR